jgi:hypothetical protein
MDESRRSLIKKAAVGGGIVWSAPVLTSVAARPAMAGTPAPSTTTSSTAPIPCDCAQPAPTGKEVVCLGTAGGCSSVVCLDLMGGDIQPCDIVSVSCGLPFPDLRCNFTFTANCGSGGGVANGVATEVNGSICPDAGVFVGSGVELFYSTQ